MELKDVLANIDVWQKWKNDYAYFVPKFIQEASTKENWSDWDQDVFYEYFEKSQDQCIASLPQGCFSKKEKQEIKNNWLQISPLLKQVAESQDVPLFDIYEQIRSIIFTFTATQKHAAVNRMIAGLQPNLLSTIVRSFRLNELYHLLREKLGIEIEGYRYNDLLLDSHKILQLFRSAVPDKSVYDIITYPWQTLLYLKESETINEMPNNNQKTIELLKYKKQIILQGPPGTGKTRLAKEIADEITKDNEKDVEVEVESKPVLTTDFIRNNLKVGQVISGKRETSFTVTEIGDKTVSVKGNGNKSWTPSYKKIILSFEKELWNTSGRKGGFKPYEDAVAKYFAENSTNNLEIKEERKVENEYIKILQFHPSYSYEDFVRGIVSIPSDDNSGILYESQNKILAQFATDALNDKNNSYVLIIDEINRANLSSVLGELIYALEYRGEEVESMYPVDGKNGLILPTNLYIIGTMNTADRSVGHIDYAIRRRFAFVDILPEDLSDDTSLQFEKDLFDTVSSLFDSNLSPEFSKKDVQLGHSYFIDKTKDGGTMDIRLEYEIKPILLEYVKDGILIGDVEGKPIREYIQEITLEE